MSDSHKDTTQKQTPTDSLSSECRAITVYKSFPPLACLLHRTSSAVPLILDPLFLSCFNLNHLAPRWQALELNFKIGRAVISCLLLVEKAINFH